jgi:hypothetical protein
MTMKTSPTPRPSRKATPSALKTSDTPKRVRPPRTPAVRRKVATPMVEPEPSASETDAPRASSTPTIEDVHRRAYEIYLGRTGNGDALSDWLQAEREMRMK